MGRYSCTRKEQTTYTNLGSALIGVGGTASTLVGLTLVPLYATAKTSD